MTIEQCYEAMGGSYEEVSSRLPSAQLVERFVRKFLTDDSFANLCREMEAGNCQDAFRAAHTLKGVCANLGFGRLQNSASSLTELLRHAGGALPAEAPVMMEQVRADYEITVGAIRTYLNEG